MQLRRIEIKNFRGIDHLSIDLVDTTVLIGENNSGKSAVLDAIRVCLSRAALRKGLWLEDYDYLLTGNTAHPGEAGTTELVLTWREDEHSEWPDSLIQSLGPAVVLGPGADLQFVILRITSDLDGSGDFITDWAFLNVDGQPLPIAKKPAIFQSLLNLAPFFYLPAQREATKEFQARSAFWGPIARDSGIDDELREELESDLAELNNKVIAAHGSFDNLKNHLSKAQKVVALSEQNQVSIDALPGKLTDLLASAQVNVASISGAKLPLARHGAGTQSMSVMFLFEAYVASKLDKGYHEAAESIVAVEEPEAHLHPSAIRGIWPLLQAMPGQKIIATHSGDLLSNIDLPSIRRLYRKNEKVTVACLQSGTLSDDELNKLQFHIRSSRAELLFARAWLLGEGETEFWLFQAIPEMLGLDLDQLGVRYVHHRWCGIEPILKLANDLGIEWHVLADGDGQGDDDEETVTNHLAGRTLQERLTKLGHPDIEVELCMNGYGHLFEASVSPQKQHLVTEPAGTPAYYAQVIKAQSKGTKPTKVREVIQAMKAPGSAGIPAHLEQAVKQAVLLAEAR